LIAALALVAREPDEIHGRRAAGPREHAARDRSQGRQPAARAAHADHGPIEPDGRTSPQRVVARRCGQTGDLFPSCRGRRPRSVARPYGASPARVRRRPFGRGTLVDAVCASACHAEAAGPPMHSKSASALAQTPNPHSSGPTIGTGRHGRIPVGSDLGVVAVATGATRARNEQSPSREATSLVFKVLHLPKGSNGANSLYQS
jgi:hypothetical protein